MKTNQSQKKKNIYKPTVASLFVGCGGLDYGFSKLGLDLVWANEKDINFAKSYEKFLNHSVIVEDIKNTIDTIPKVDIIIGGPPCQSFSLVGKRLEDDERSSMVFYFLKAIVKIKPEIFVMENVPGIISSVFNNIKLTDFLIAEFQRYGYEIQVKKLLATDFYVPQRRKRIFFIGRKKKYNIIEPFLKDKLAKYLKFSNIVCPVNVKQALDDLPKPNYKNNFSLIQYNCDPQNDFQSFMRENNNIGVTFHSYPQLSETEKKYLEFIPPGGNYMDVPDDYSTKRIMNFKRTGGRTTTYGRLHPEKPAYTINTYFNRPNVGANFHYAEKRLITVREAMRLQTFPDYFEPNYSNLRNLHTQIGNAVPPLLSLGVALGIQEVIL